MVTLSKGTYNLLLEFLDETQALVESDEEGVFDNPFVEKMEELVARISEETQ